MGLSGNLGNISFGDLLHALMEGRRSGTLTLHGAKGQAVVVLHRGSVVSANGPTSGRLGELLIAKGSIRLADLESALWMQHEAPSRLPLGRILLCMHAIDDDQLSEAVRAQAATTLKDVKSWTRGLFYFDFDLAAPPDQPCLDADEAMAIIGVDARAPSSPKLKAAVEFGRTSPER